MILKKINVLSNPLFIAGILVFITIIITADNLLLGPKTFGACEILYTHYNNYLIFKQSFFHLIENKDLYQLYPTEHWDYYKYSPAFSLLMAPLACLPDVLGLLAWNLLNVLILFLALWKLPFRSDKTRLFVLGFITIELITSIQNSQSNALMAGLIIFALVFLERKQMALASLFIVMSIFIKLFGVVALALFIFYPDKRKAVIYTIGWTLLLTLLPLIVISSSQLYFLYQSWFHLLQNDHSISVGLSVAGLLQSWFGIDWKNGILVIGVLLFCLPLLKYKFFNEMKFKLFFLSAILIWIIIFNHKAESPSFVIAISGVAIWFFSQRVKTVNLVLLIMAFILTVLSPTDIFPRSIRENYLVPYVLKALPCIIIWIKIILDLIFYRSENDLIESPSLKNNLTKA
jgi:hypothetical protein